MAADMIARGMANSAQKKADSAYDLAAGRALALSVTNIQKLVSDFNTASNTYAKVGDNIYIQQLNVPDFWVFKVDATRADYTYTTDQAFLQAIARNGYVKVGYFQISQLESKHQVTFGYYYGNQFYYNAGHTDQIIPDENGMFFDIPTKDGYVYRDGAYTQIINSTEETERKREDEALGGRIDAEETARESADTQLTNDLAAEAQARAAADGTLQANIDAEGATRASADEALTEALASEETARAAADIELGKDVNAITMPRDPETITIGGKVHVLANGTPITISDSGSANVITWFGANSAISGNHNQVSQPNSMTVPYGALIFGGGYGKRANDRDKSVYFVNSQITINDGKLERVFGGCLGTGAVGVATITVNGGIITKGLHGGGQKGGDALMHSNSVGSVNITINGGTFNSVLTAGGVDAVNVGESKMTINGGSIKWLVASGSNGTVGQSKVIFNGGSVSEDALSVNRGYVQDVEWTINGGSINRLWSGADNDIDDNGSIAHCIINVLGGRVIQLKRGYTATQLMANGAVKGTYRYEADIDNFDEAKEECNLTLDQSVRLNDLQKAIKNHSHFCNLIIHSYDWERGSVGQRPVLRLIFEKMPFTDWDLIQLQSSNPLFKEFELRIVEQGMMDINNNIVEYNGETSLEHEEGEPYYSYIDIECDCDKSNPIFPSEDIECKLYIIKAYRGQSYLDGGCDKIINYINDPKWLAPKSEGSSSSNIVTQDGNPIGTQDGHGLTIFD